MLLLKIVYVPLTCVSSPSYIPNIFQIYFFIVSQICWMLYFKVVLELIFSWFDVYLSSIMTSMPEILISLTLFESQRFLFDFLNFFLFPGFPWFWFSLLILFSAPTLFYSFPSTICFCFLGFLLGFVRVLFKTSTIVVKAVLRSQSCDSAMLQFSGPNIVTFPDSNRHILLVVIDSVFTLAYRHSDDCNSQCRYLVLSLLCGSLAIWFPFLSFVLQRVIACLCIPWQEMLLVSCQVVTICSE